MILLESTPICKNLDTQTKDFAKQSPVLPHLAVIQVGDCAASTLFIQKKQIAAEKLGFQFTRHKLPNSISEETLTARIHALNSNPEVTGILLQLPLPAHLDAWKMTNLIAYDKDVDCLSSRRMGEFLTQDTTIIPATAKAIALLCEHYQISVSQKHAVIIGSSNLVGKPAAIWLNRQGATVTLCHALSVDMSKHIQDADIIVSATGKGDVLTHTMLNPKHIVFDIGIRKENNTYVGDVDSPEARKIVDMITPVPGGIGPITVAVLMNSLAYLSARPAS